MKSTAITDLLTKNFELAGKAIENHDDAALKRKCCNLVIITRFEARKYVDRHKQAKEKLQQAMRAVKKAEAGGVTSLLTAKWISELYKQVEVAQEVLYRYGMTAAVILDRWQIAGATLKDLCDLCDKDYNLLIAKLDPKEYNDQFSTLITAHNIDDALTYLFREMLSYVMSHTKIGREVGRNGFDLLFPGLMDNALSLLSSQRIIDDNNLSMDDLFDADEDFR